VYIDPPEKGYKFFQISDQGCYISMFTKNLDLITFLFKIRTLQRYRYVLYVKYKLKQYCDIYIYDNITKKYKLVK